MKYQLDPRPLPKSKGLRAWDKGLEDKGRGSDKGPITVAKGSVTTEVKGADRLVMINALAFRKLSRFIDWPETDFREAREIGTDKSAQLK